VAGFHLALNDLKNKVDQLHPDAFVCVNDRTAGRLKQGLLAQGYQIPRGIRMVGIDDVEYAKLP